MRVPTQLRVTEDDFQLKIIQLARLEHWLVSHQRPAWTERGYRTALQGDAGLPDLILLKPPRLIFAELKTQEGWTSAKQDIWLEALYMVGSPVEVYLWRPDNWNAIVEVLSRRG